MGIKRGSITTSVVADGLIFNMDPANRISYPKTGTTVTDTIGNITGTLNGTGGSNNTPQWENTNGGVFDFDGTDDYIDFGDPSILSFGNGTTDSPFSVSFFVNLNSYPPYNFCFVSKDDGSPNREYAIGMFSGNRYVRFFIKNQGGNDQQSVDSTTTIALGNWYHVVATYDGRGTSDAADGMNLYINSIKETTGAFKQSYTAMANTTAPFRIGQYVSQAYVDGKISCTHVYNRTLSASEVLHNYNALKGRFGLS